MNIRRAIVCVLLLALLLPSCRESGGLHIQTDAGDGASGSAKDGVLTGVYRGAELPLPDGVSVDSMRIGPGGIRIDETGGVTLWATDADGRIRLVTTGRTG